MWEGDSLLPPAPVHPFAGAAGSAGVEARLACAVRYESQGNPNATNPWSGAAGLYQFLRSTWLTTRPGKDGMSPYDPVAAHAAAIELASQPGGFDRHWGIDARLGC